MRHVARHWARRRRRGSSRAPVASRAPPASPPGPRPRRGCGPPPPRRRGASPSCVVAQCRKWRSPVRTMATPCSSAAATISASRTDPPGLDHRGHPGDGQDVETVAEREEGVAGGGPARASVPRLAHGDLRRLHAALLAGAHAERLAALDDDYGVGRRARRTPARRARGRATGGRWAPPSWPPASPSAPSRAGRPPGPGTRRRGCAARGGPAYGAGPRAAAWPCDGRRAPRARRRRTPVPPPRRPGARRPRPGPPPRYTARRAPPPRRRRTRGSHSRAIR